MILLEIKNATVIGAGIMGHGIAEVLALSGLNVVVNDVSQDFLDRARQNVQSSLARMKEGGKINESVMNDTLARLSFSTDIKNSVAKADIIVEAVPEVLDIKKSVIKEVESSCSPDAIIASNTSNFRITELQEGSVRPKRIVGMHFFNPPVVLKLVEVVKGEKTDNQTFEAVYDLSRKIGKTPIRVVKDSPGFVVNRINAPESLFFCLLLDRKIDSPASIDIFARSQGLPMGPYELMDYVGIDTVVHSLEYYAKELSPEYGKCMIFRQMMEQNKLGRKTGHGFYTWESGKAQIPSGEPSSKVELMDVLAIELNEAVKLIEEGVASPEDIETGVRLGMNRPFGPISVAQGLTNAEIKKKLEDLSARFESTVFAPARSIAEGKLNEAISGKTGAGQEEKPAAPKTEVHDEPVFMVKKDKVAIVYLNNGRLNLLNAAVLDGLEKTLHEIRDDREVNVVVVTGKGTVFSAGAELSQFFSGGIDFMQASRHGQSIFRLLSEMNKITIAEIKGYALGGGFELSLACDIRVSSPDAKIGFPELQRGLVPGWGGTQRLAKLVGASRASYLILTAERITGKEAFDMGIVTRTFGADTIDDDVLKFAHDLSRKVAPGAAFLAKLLVNKGSETSLDDGLTMEAISMGLVYGTEDLKEGISSFLQKREPEFKGR
ncbi:MAG: 3-hydroxyacyl-CoA dehydrogenase NAD-binding domain-containing protein [Thermoplasmataceae archaeon]